MFYTDKIKEFFRKHGTLLSFIGLGIIIIVLSVLLLPLVLSLRDEAKREQFTAFVEGLGVWGPMLMLAVQILQVIVAVIPGEPIEILSGLMYGTFGGLALCLAGVLIATVSLYFFVRRLGRAKLSDIYEKEENAKYSFLFKSGNITYLIFILFLIPGTPKDVLTYLCPFTKIKPLTYFAISTFARIPSIVTSTMVGSNLAEGKLLTSVLIFAATGLVGLAGISFNNYFTKKKTADSENTK